MTIDIATCEICHEPFAAFADDLMPCRTSNDDGSYVDNPPVLVCHECQLRHCFDDDETPE